MRSDRDDVSEPAAMPSRIRMGTLATVVAVLALVATGCGDDGGGDADSGADTDAQAQNACPPGGCTITIDDVTATGDELAVTWTANFDPDVSRNHIHVYWDTYDPDQVSNDAADRGVTQGDWVPTDANPEFTTEGAVSVANAGDSTTICVTAADRDHNVLDSLAEDCRDVAELLP